MRKRSVWIFALLLTGCGVADGERPQAEFILSDVPAASVAQAQGLDMLKIQGHGKTCYIAAFGVSKVLLWCE